jgi:hypothetical protein
MSDNINPDRKFRNFFYFAVLYKQSMSNYIPYDAYYDDLLSRMSDHLRGEGSSEPKLYESRPQNRQTAWFPDVFGPHSLLPLLARFISNPGLVSPACTGEVIRRGLSREHRLR